MQAGFNIQTGNTVYGIEADWAWTGYSEDRIFTDDYSNHDLYVKAQMDWLATLRGRLGVASGNGMAYVTGGLALAHLGSLRQWCRWSDTVLLQTVTMRMAWDGVQPGLVAGAGVEARLSEHLSLKGEYLYLRMADKNVVYDNTADGNGTDQDIDFGHNAHLFRVGLNLPSTDRRIITGVAPAAAASVIQIGCGRPSARNHQF